MLLYYFTFFISDPLPLLEKWFNENNESKISRIPLPDDDGCILSDVNQELEEIKKKKQIDSDLDFISNHKSPIQQANQGKVWKRKEKGNEIVILLFCCFVGGIMVRHN